MTAAPEFELQSKPCLEVVFSDERRLMTVAEYHEVQQRWRDQPLWARRVPPVWELPAERGAEVGYEVLISYPSAYRAQMRVLLGLDAIVAGGGAS